MQLKASLKHTDIGILPEEWNAKPLRDVLEKARLGGNYPNQGAETEFPLMKMGNIARGVFDITSIEYISPRSSPDPQHRLSRGDVLFNTRNTLDLVGKVAMWRDELPVAYYNSNLLRLEFKANEIASGEYANYCLNANDSVSRLRALATGTTSVAAIYTRDLLSFLVAVPPHSEQLAIARALSDVDALLVAQHALIGKKRAIRQGAMLELLTGKRRMPGFGGDWISLTLGDIVEEFVGGGTPSRAVRKFWMGEIPWITVKDFATFNPRQSQEYITRLGLLSSASNLVAKGTLITATRMALGKAAMYEVDVAINQDLKALRFKPSVSASFMLEWFSLFGRKIYEMGSGSTVKGVSIGELKRMEVLLPTLEEQCAVTKALNDMSVEIEELEKKRAKTVQLKRAMMQSLLTGRIRLAETDEQKVVAE